VSLSLFFPSAGNRAPLVARAAAPLQREVSGKNTTDMHIIAQNIIRGKQDMCVELDKNHVKYTSEIMGEKKILGFAEKFQ
jgi:hypothetical protein